MGVETLEGSRKGKRNMEELNLSGKKTPSEHVLVDEEIVEVKKTPHVRLAEVEDKIS